MSVRQFYDRTWNDHKFSSNGFLVQDTQNYDDVMDGSDEPYEKKKLFANLKYFIKNSITSLIH